MTIQEFAELLGTTLEQGEQKILNTIGDDCQYFTSKNAKQQNLELLYFALISMVKKCNNILEIGTGKGYMAHCLSLLFPDAQIYTFDIPPDDKQYESLAIRIGDELYFEKNISKPNVKFFPRNSFFMPQCLDESIKFDLVWLDGGHEYPAVAWDLMYSYNHLLPNGYLFIHDYNKADNNVKECVNSVGRIIKETIHQLPFAGYLPNVKTCWIRKNE